MSIKKLCGYVDMSLVLACLKDVAAWHNTGLSPAYPQDWPGYPYLSTNLSTDISTEESEPGGILGVYNGTPYPESCFFV